MHFLAAWDANNNYNLLHNSQKKEKIPLDLVTVKGLIWFLLDFDGVSLMMVSRDLIVF